MLVLTNRSKTLSLLTRCLSCWDARIPPQLTQVPTRAAAAVVWAYKYKETLLEVRSHPDNQTVALMGGFRAIFMQKNLPRCLSSHAVSLFLLQLSLIKTDLPQDSTPCSIWVSNGPLLGPRVKHIIRKSASPLHTYTPRCFFTICKVIYIQAQPT